MIPSLNSSTITMAEQISAAVAAPNGPALVWLKRDLRSYDHEPLMIAAEAARNGQGVAVLYIIEPAWLDDENFDSTHLWFVLQSLNELRNKGVPVMVREGSATEVLRAVHSQFPFATLLSHQETGSWWTYQRDLSVRIWCAESGVHWVECYQDGCIRRLRDRDGWAQRWKERMQRPLLGHVEMFPGPPDGLDVQPLPTLQSLGLRLADVTLQQPGEDAAWALLKTWLDGRARDYRQGMSSPVTAVEKCSRLSPYLAYGNISMKAVHQFTQWAIERSEDRQLVSALRAFGGRLHWHCHFMQKLESEPELEWRNLVRSADGLRPGDTEPMGEQAEALMHAWALGQTGYPMVDACMRYLRHHRWLNFRMRAMVTSFASYHLWLHWRQTGHVLGRLFLDYEPGIHWSQMQMQSGTTGINTVRIYSPIKQAQDQDPDGEFINRWVPEVGTGAYPKPLVDHAQAVALAKQRIYTSRRSEQARLEATLVVEKHGSRKNPMHRVKATGNRLRPPI